MSETEFDVEIVKKTQESLGKFVKKPPLTEKLLRRPPFKFIHDVVKVVINNSNILEDLYTDDELNVDNIKDRAEKMKFLQKLIDLLNLVSNRKIDVKPSKIVAGLEADKTNELFQALAQVIEDKIDTKEAVNRVKNGNVVQNGKESKTKTSKDEKTRKSSIVKVEQKKKIVSQNSIEKKTTASPQKIKEKPEKDKDQRNGKERSTSKSRNPNEIKKVKRTSSKDKEVTAKRLTNGGSIDSQNSQNSLTIQQQSLTIEEQTTTVDDVKATVEEINHETPKEIETIDHDTTQHEEKVNEPMTNEILPTKPQDELVAIIDEEAEYRRKEKTSKKLSSKHRQKSLEEQQSQQIENHENQPKIEMSQIRPKTTLRPPSARPASSRPAAPRRREKNVEIILQPDESVKLGEITVKMENFTKELEDDGENLLIIEDPNVEIDNFMNENKSTSNQIEGDDENGEEQGKLVQQILETEKNFEGTLGVEKKIQRIESDYDESKVQTNFKQIENLKELIQKLVRSVNPLGKLMDFVQEDIDSMQREYSKWNEIYKQSTFDLKKELNETATAIEPLKYQLNQLEKQIIEHQQVIDELRGKLILDEQKIQKIFSD